MQSLNLTFMGGMELAPHAAQWDHVLTCGLPGFAGGWLAKIFLYKGKPKRKYFKPIDTIESENGFVFNVYKVQPGLYVSHSMKRYLLPDKYYFSYTGRFELLKGYHECLQRLHAHAGTNVF